jgi:hypothetical protein
MNADTHQNNKQLLCRIEAHLREDGQQMIGRVPKNLHQDIMSAVDTAHSSPKHAQTYPFPMWAIALAASIVVLLGVTPVAWQTYSHLVQPSAMAELNIYEHETLALIVDLPQRISEPMELELSYLTDDIRRGTEFLLDQLN